MHVISITLIIEEIKKKNPVVINISNKLHVTKKKTTLKMFCEQMLWYQLISITVWV